MVSEILTEPLECPYGEQELAKIQTMAKFGLSLSEIAFLHDVATNQFRKWPKCRDAVKRGRLEAKTRVGATLYRMAISGEQPQVSMFYAKCRMGWKEAQGFATDEESGKGERAAQVIADKLDRLAKTLAKAQQKPRKGKDKEGATDAG